MKKKILAFMLAALMAAAASVCLGGTKASASEQVPQVPAAVDTNVYGNTPGNIENGGLFLEDENFYYLFNGYDNCVYRTDKTSGASVQLGSAPMQSMNMVDGKIYGYRTDGFIMEVNPVNAEERVVRAGKISGLLAVNRDLYFTSDEDDSFRKLNLDSGQEIVLVPQGVTSFSIYKDRAYFTFALDNETLYSMPSAGGEAVKLNNVMSYLPLVYRDRAYYLACENDVLSLRSIMIDGSGEQVIANVPALFMNVIGNKLFYVNSAMPEEMYFIDLDAPVQVPVRFDPSAAMELAVKKYSIDPPESYAVTAYKAINFGRTRMLLMCNEIMDGENWDDVYLYDFAANEIMPIAYFCWKDEGAKPAAGGTQVTVPVNIADPAGDYNVGSIYGPKLTKKELAEVKEAVKKFLSRYDFSTMSDYKKVEAAQDYIMDICEYAPNWWDNGANTAWGALVYGEAQCSGYARAMKALCDAIGIGCYYVHADQYAVNPDHQWNEVCIDGQWYIIDVQGNDKSRGRMAYLVSGDTFARTTGMSWDRSSVPECPKNFGEYDLQLLMESGANRDSKGRTWYQYSDGWFTYDY